MMSNKRILITGASSGLGQELARKLGAFGNSFVLVARREDALLALKDELLSINPANRVEILAADIAKNETNQKAIERAEKAFQGLDIFIANAGQSMWCRFRDAKDPKGMTDLMELNFNGLLYGLHHALPLLIKSSGSFIAISSIQGAIPMPYHSAYVASKYAVNGLIETVRLEEPGVHFLLALPAWIKGTELRQKALKATSADAVQVSIKHRNKAMDVADVAQEIIDAIKQKTPRLFLPHKFSMIPIVRSMFPKFVDNMILKKVNKELT